jgi:hypothetical protein
MRRIQFNYRNHRGKVELRTIELLALHYESQPNPEYGYAPGWFLYGNDYTVRDGVEREGIPRSFALTHIQMDGFNPISRLSWRLDVKGESIIDFLAWASVQPEAFTLGSAHEAGPAVEALKLYEKQGVRSPYRGELVRSYADDGLGGKVDVTTINGQ